MALGPLLGGWRIVHIMGSGVARGIVVAWVVTMPMSGLIAAAFYLLADLFA